MRDKKYYIALDDFERRVVVNCLNEMRNNRRIGEHRLNLWMMKGGSDLNTTAFLI